MGGCSVSGEFTAEVSMVMVGARSLRRVDWPGSSFGRGSDIVGVCIQCAIHAWHTPGFIDGRFMEWRRGTKCRENDRNSINS